jgi:ribonuclease R
VEELRETLATFQIDLPRRRALKPRDIQHVLDLVRGRPEQGLLQNLILRSLAKARYETENLGHFGLASGGYLHFTSPIRRYPDLVVHRAVVEVLLDSGAGKERLPGREALAEVADHCSEREQAAEEAERASVALKKVEFMERHLGEVFAGRISGVIGFGLFVVLEDFFVEGLVHVGSLGDDFYRLDPRRHALVGDRGGRGFRLGDRVAVQVARVDKDARQIDFSLVRKLKPLNP